MSEKAILFLIILAPAAFVATAIASWFQPGFRPHLIKRLSMSAAFLSILVAALSGFFVYEHGLLQSGLIGFSDIGFSIRLDALSSLMLGMIALLGFIIVRFSGNYLDGDRRQGTFIGRLAATIASVQLLVLSGNLGLLFAAWILTSISLHRLLVFYHDRPRAQIAARKKFILARLGDVCLLVAFGLLYLKFGSGNLEVIFQAIKGNSLSNPAFGSMEVPALFLVAAALLKSAQFPTHGWLIEVMETPTPVSALLHAGLLNAGPFLIIRMAHVMDASSIAPIALMTIGAFTALFGSVVYLTQTSVKTALSYSSVAHMGFSLMACGLGAYAAAMLHLVAHSFYKAHAFLSSGSVIDVVRASKVAGITRSFSTFKIVMGIAMALALYTGFALMWGVDSQRDWGLIFIGAVIIMGLARIFTTVVDAKGGTVLMTQATLLAFVVTAAFFTFESGIHYLIVSQLPLVTELSLAKLIIGGIILCIFSLAVFIQLIGPQFANWPICRTLAIHIRNDLYVNALFDRAVGALRLHSPESKQLIHTHMSIASQTKNTSIDALEKQLIEG